MKTIDRDLEVVAADEPHGVIRPAIRIFTLAVDGHDAGMLKVTGDLRLEDKPRPALVVGCDLFLELLERDFTVDLAVARQKDAAQAPLVMQAR